MKLLFLTNKPPYPPKDGGAIATLAMINAFARAGHETTVLAMNTRKHHVTPWDLSPDLTNQTILHLVEVPAQITAKGAIFNFFFSKLPYNAERFIDKKYQNKLLTLLETHSYDIIQIEGLYLLPYVPAIKEVTNSVIVYRSHNIEHEIWQRTTANAKGLRKIYLQHLTRRMMRFEHEVVNQYDLVVPITHRDALKLDEMGNTKPSFVVPAGVDTALKTAVDPFEMNIFYIGALDWTPNQDGILWFVKKCFSLVLKGMPRVRLKIAGRNAPDWLKKELVHPNIDFLGEIDDAGTYMAENGVMIVPLFSGSGMRVKIIEGMARAKAIVTTTIGCEGIDAENGKMIYIADDAPLFAKYLLSLLSNRKKVETMGLEAARFVNRYYNNDELIANLTQFYNKHLK
jgi:glycosyltransferase involved in cell wall biosynthesis